MVLIRPNPKIIHQIEFSMLLGEMCDDVCYAREAQELVHLFTCGKYLAS